MHASRCASLLSALLLSIIGSSNVAAGAKGDVHTGVPEAVDPARNYLFYMHGKWLEMHEPGEPSPRHGPYEYDKIVKALAGKGFVVISEVRRTRVQTLAYADKVAGQVRRLLERGVPPEKITVIGHSKGGMMTLIAATVLQRPRINCVVMAGCGKAGTKFRKSYERFLERRAPKLHGRILSLYDGGGPRLGILPGGLRQGARCRSQGGRASHGPRARALLFARSDLDRRDRRVGRIVGERADDGRL